MFWSIICVMCQVSWDPVVHSSELARTSLHLVDLSLPLGSHLLLTLVNSELLRKSRRCSLLLHSGALLLRHFSGDLSLFHLVLGFSWKSSGVLGWGCLGHLLRAVSVNTLHMVK